MGSILGCIRLQMLTMLPVVALLGAQHYEASTGTCLSMVTVIVHPDLMSRNVRKPIFRVSDQVQHKLACTVTEAG